MMIKNTAIIDIGSNSIKTFVIDQEEKYSKIVGFDKSMSNGFDGNKINNFDTFVDSIKNSINKAQKQSSSKVKNIILITPTSKNKNHLISEVIELNGAQIEDNHLRQLNKSMIIKYKTKLTHCFKSHYVIDNKIITDSPIGINCGSLSLNAIATIISDEEIKLFKNIFSKIGLNLIFIYDSSIIYYLYLKSLNLHKKNIVFIDIGSSTTKILTIKDEKISLLKTLPIGSMNITNDLMTLNISKDFAEKIKTKNIDLILNDHSSVEIPVWEELGKNQKQTKSYEFIQSIVTARVDEIFKLVLSSIPKSKFFYSYLVTGGGSMQLNLIPYVKSKFGIELELVEPKQVKGIPTFWNNPSIMLPFCLNSLIENGYLDKFNLFKKNDSFSNKIWYKRFVDLL